MTHVLFLNPVGVIGGAERVLLSAVDAVRRLRPSWRVSVVLLDGGPLEERLADLGVDVHVVSLPPAFSRLGDTQLRAGNAASRLWQLAWTTLKSAPSGWNFLRRLRRVVRDLNPTLIHSNGMKTHLFAYLAGLNHAPVVWHLHDYCSQRPVMAKVLKRISRNVTGAVAVSESVKSDAKAIIPELNTTVVMNAVDTDHFTPALARGTDLDRLAGLALAPTGVIRIGLVATYANWKGQDVFLDAVAKLSHEPSIRAYIVGGPIYETAGSQFTLSELRSRASALGIRQRVGFVPFQPDPAAVYQMLDIVVHASARPEPFGLTIAEAMACGRAVVVARAGGAAELFTPNFDGIGHEPGDACNLAGAIQWLVADSNLRKRLETNARTTAERNFHLSRFSDELISFYEQHLNGGTRSRAGRFPRELHPRCA